MEEAELGVSGISRDHHFSKTPVFELFTHIINSRCRTPLRKVPREDLEKF